jgi:MoxR-like ATPase
MLNDESPEATLAAGAVRPVVHNGGLTAMRTALQQLTVREELVAYMVDLIRKTRAHESVLVGSGPRATQGLLLASRAYAAIVGRDFVTPDDIKAVAIPVLEHRLLLRPEYEIEGLTPAEVIGKILQEIPIPR